MRSVVDRNVVMRCIPVVTWLRGRRPRNCGSNPSGIKDVFLWNIHKDSGPTQPPKNGYWGYFPGGKGDRMETTTRLHLVPRLRMSGATPLLLPIWPDGVQTASFPF